MDEKFIKFRYYFQKIYVYKDNLEIKGLFKSETIKKSQIKGTTLSSFNTKLKIYVDGHKDLDINLFDSKKVKDLYKHLNGGLTFEDLYDKYSEDKDVEVRTSTKTTLNPKVLSKAFGIILFFIGFILLFTDFISGFLILLSGLIVFPRTFKFINNKISYNLSSKFRIIIVVILLIASTMFIDNPEISDNDIEKNKRSEVMDGNPKKVEESSSNLDEEDEKKQTKTNNIKNESLSFSDKSKERFKEIEESFQEINNIECYNDDCTSVIYFNFNVIPEDLDLLIRSNTATFSRFKLENTGTSHVTIFARYNDDTVFQCDGSKGVVDECS